ncbi:MAG TPA: 5'/3'-nucleotidase SurE [Vicinamibacterales bacterium]|nr:5'/3'-nucleotidase SurE [Vicinamibacterales bacterium]
MCLLAVAATQSTRPYRILISNDDGVRAPALPVLADALKPVGEVIVVAPAEDQSGVSQGLTAVLPIARTDVTLAGGLRAIGLTATPATTIQIAIKNIVMPRPDLVVTGINTAYNVGTSAYLSGTVGAARQAVMEGVPAVATSMAAAGVPRDFASAAQQVVAIVRQVRDRGLPPQTFLNVNIPPMPPGGYRGLQVTTQAPVRAGTETFAETTRPGTDRTVYWSVYKEGASAAQGTDVWAVNNGYVSITPMHATEYDDKLAVALRNWFK